MSFHRALESCIALMPGGSWGRVTGETAEQEFARRLELVRTQERERIVRVLDGLRRAAVKQPSLVQGLECARAVIATLRPGDGEPNPTSPTYQGVELPYVRDLDAADLYPPSPCPHEFFPLDFSVRCIRCGREQ